MVTELTQTLLKEQSVVSQTDGKYIFVAQKFKFFGFKMFKIMG
jgi:hypothetical protein